MALGNFPDSGGNETYPRIKRPVNGPGGPIAPVRTPPAQYPTAPPPAMPVAAIPQSKRPAMGGPMMTNRAANPTSGDPSAPAPAPAPSPAPGPAAGPTPAPAQTNAFTPQLQAGWSPTEAAHYLLSNGMQGKEMTDYLRAQGYQDNGLYYPDRNMYGFANAYMGQDNNGGWYTNQRVPETQGQDGSQFDWGSLLSSLFQQPQQQQMPSINVTNSGIDPSVLAGLMQQFQQPAQQQGVYAQGYMPQTQAPAPTFGGTPAQGGNVQTQTAATTQPGTDPFMAWLRGQVFGGGQ